MKYNTYIIPAEEAPPIDSLSPIFIPSLDFILDMIIQTQIIGCSIRQINKSNFTCSTRDFPKLKLLYK